FMVFRNLYKDLLENPPKESEPKFKVNQKVRWSLVKPVFEKGYFPRWSLEIGHIAEIKQTDPITYVVLDANNESEYIMNKSCFPYKRNQKKETEAFRQVQQPSKITVKNVSPEM
ncbi:hypothetical protein Fcan01_12836, partial [Folsomia candida]